MTTFAMNRRHHFRIAGRMLLAFAAGWSLLGHGAAQTVAPPEGAPQDAPAAAAPAGSAPAGQPRRQQRAYALNSMDARLGRLSADLQLDASQRSRIRPILERQAQDMTAVQRTPGLTQADRSRRLQEVAARSVEQIRTQLNDEQRKQYIQPAARPVASSSVRVPAKGPNAARPSREPASGARK